jgi:hypothetical protein
VVFGAVQHFEDQRRSETCEDLLYKVKVTPSVVRQIRPQVAVV